MAEHHELAADQTETESIVYVSGDLSRACDFPRSGQVSSVKLEDRSDVIDNIVPEPRSKQRDPVLAFNDEVNHRNCEYAIEILFRSLMLLYDLDCRAPPTRR